MKKIISILLSIVALYSCSTIYGPNMSERAKQLDLGITKQKAIDIMGKDYYIESAYHVPEGKVEVLHFRSTYYQEYLLYFTNNRLAEFHRYQQPEPIVVERERPITNDYYEDIVVESSRGKKKTIKKDIFGDTVIEDNKGNKTTIKKDIFGDTVIEDNKGRKKTVKKDIFGDTVIEDNKGNKTTIKKDIFGDTVIEDNKGNKRTVKKDVFGDIIIENN